MFIILKRKLEIKQVYNTRYKINKIIIINKVKNLSCLNQDLSYLNLDISRTSVKVQLPRRLYHELDMNKLDENA